jgi:very-short-patch-repair endonuclease
MRGQINKRILKPKLQRCLRNASTEAEQKLWQRLGGRQLEGCKFRRQHPYFDFILDFVCLERRLVVEVDGGQHADSPTDASRDAFLQRSGFRLLRFWNNEVMENTDEVVEVIWRNLMALSTPSPPYPPLEGEG